MKWHRDFWFILITSCSEFSTLKVNTALISDGHSSSLHSGHWSQTELTFPQSPFNSEVSVVVWYISDVKRKQENRPACFGMLSCCLWESLAALLKNKQLCIQHTNASRFSRGGLKQKKYWIGCKLSDATKKRENRLVYMGHLTEDSLHWKVEQKKMKNSSRLGALLSLLKAPFILLFL